MKIDFDCLVCLPKKLIYVTMKRTVDHLLLLLLPTWKFVLMIDYLMIHPPYVISLMICPHGSLLMMILEQAVTAAMESYFVAVEIEMMIEADDEMV